MEKLTWVFSAVSESSSSHRGLLHHQSKKDPNPDADTWFLSLSLDFPIYKIMFIMSISQIFV